MSKIKYDSDWLQIRAKDYIDHVGNRHQWEYVSRKDSNRSVCIVPMMRMHGKPDRVVLIKQYRPAISQYILGLPSGRIIQGEDIETAAHRELKEETGYEGQVIGSFKSFYPVPESSCEEVNVVTIEVNDFHTKIDNGIEIIDVEIMEIATLLAKLTSKSEMGFDLRILSVFLQLMCQV